MTSYKRTYKYAISRKAALTFVGGLFLFSLFFFINETGVYAQQEKAIDLSFSAIAAEEKSAEDQIQGSEKVAWYLQKSKDKLNAEVDRYLVNELTYLPGVSPDSMVDLEFFL